MSRYSSSGAYGFNVQVLGFYGIYYRLSWTVDHYYEGSRLRYPRRCTRDTDEKGARRFCKKHGIPFPEQEAKNVREGEQS